jgi:hypothetical protein
VIVPKSIAYNSYVYVRTSNRFVIGRTDFGFPTPVTLIWIEAPFAIGCTVTIIVLMYSELGEGYMFE